MRYREALVRALVDMIGRLTRLQYRCASLCIAAASVVLLYIGPLQIILRAATGVNGVGSELDALRLKRSDLLRQLREIEQARQRVSAQSRQGRTSFTSEHREIVNLIDQASRSASVSVGALQAIGSSANGVGRSRQRHRLAVFGDYWSITRFIEALSEESSPLIVIEITIASVDWQYPRQPLEASLVLESQDKRRLSETVSDGNGG